MRSAGACCNKKLSTEMKIGVNTSCPVKTTVKLIVFILAVRRAILAELEQMDKHWDNLTKLFVALAKLEENKEEE